MPERVDIAAVVLAAGRSSRMERHKLLLPLGGHPLVTYAVGAALSSPARPVLVVVGYCAREVSATLPAPDVTVVTNAAFAAGMSTSLKAGIAAVPAAARGALVMLADQPLVSARFVSQMLDAATDMPEAIIAAVYAGQRATPVYFPRALFDELQAISGDEGGRAVLAAHPERIRLVAAASPLAGTDVDRPGEYEELVANWHRYSQLLEG